MEGDTWSSMHDHAEKTVQNESCRKRRRVVHTEYYGMLRNGVRDGLYKIVLSGDCDPIVMVTWFQNGNMVGENYAYLRDSGRLLYSSTVEDGVVKKEEKLSGCDVFNGILDFPDGSRWEGFFTLNRSCGQGKKFSDLNSLIYEGMEVNNFYEGSGISYIDEPFSSIPSYSGEWCHGRKHGFGKSFDLKGDVIREGMWLNDLPVDDHIHVTGDVDLVEFSCRIETCSIASDSFNTSSSLNLSKCQCLCLLQIGDRSCRNVASFCLQGLRSLEVVVIGNHSFSTVSATWEAHRRMTNHSSKSFLVQNCHVLSSLSIGRNSFSDFASFSVSGRLPFRFPQRMSFAGRVENWKGLTSRR